MPKHLNLPIISEFIFLILGCLRSLNPESLDVAQNQFLKLFEYIISGLASCFLDGNDFVASNGLKEAWEKRVIGEMETAVSKGDLQSYITLKSEVEDIVIGGFHSQFDPLIKDRCELDLGSPSLSKSRIVKCPFGEIVNSNSSAQNERIPLE